MNVLKYTAILFSIFLTIAACTYKRGDIYRTSLTNDSLNFVIMRKGMGHKLSNEAVVLKQKNEMKGNSCKIYYVTDSMKMENEKGILFFSATLPDLREDILAKGYFGSFTSKQEIILMLVSYEELNSYFTKAK